MGRGRAICSLGKLRQESHSGGKLGGRNATKLSRRARSSPGALTAVVTVPGHKARRKPARIRRTRVLQVCPFATSADETPSARAARAATRCRGAGCRGGWGRTALRNVFVNIHPTHGARAAVSQ
jgi:hypothetical protein